MFMIILKILAMWTMVSIALALVVGPYLKRLRQSQSELEFLRRHRVPANHLPPLPEGSILGNHSERVSQSLYNCIGGSNNEAI